jgi:hypothetical protein
VGVALGGPDLGMTQQPPDHFQRCPAGHQQRGEGVAEVVDADVLYPGAGADALPKLLKVAERLAREAPLWQPETP